MKTTHEVARELMALPDVPLVIEQWASGGEHEIVATMTGYDPTGTAILLMHDRSRVDYSSREGFVGWLTKRDAQHLLVIKNKSTGAIGCICRDDLLISKNREALLTQIFGEFDVVGPAVTAQEFEALTGPHK